LSKTIRLRSIVQVKSFLCTDTEALHSYKWHYRKSLSKTDEELASKDQAQEEDSGL